MEERVVSRRLVVRKAFTEAKADSIPNEDRFELSEDALRCAVSDGASVSFDSATLAAILVKRFIADPSVNSEWVTRAAEEFALNYDRDQLPWMMQAAFDLGSFASLVGVNIRPDLGTADVLCIGDSVFALFDGGNLIEFLPYTDPADFDQSPTLLSTNHSENRWFADDAPELLRRQVCLAAYERPKLVLMTDALGRWMLEGNPEHRIEELGHLQDQEAFRSFVALERAEGRLIRDDTTFVLLEIV